jgi:hypothetical protein
VKVRLKGDNRLENAYVVRDGKFDSPTATFEEKTVILALIAEWEASLPKTAADSGDVNDAP